MDRLGFIQHEVQPFRLDLLENFIVRQSRYG